MRQKISEYLDANFTPLSRPDHKTIVAWIKSGRIPGEKIGGCWYVGRVERELHPVTKGILGR